MSRPYDLLVQPTDREVRPLPAGIPIGAVFDELAKTMLILSASGAGKTTLLLELARDLLDRAEQDTSYPHAGGLSLIVLGCAAAPVGGLAGR